MDIKLECKIPEFKENDSIYRKIFIYELKSFFDYENYPPLEPNNELTQELLEIAHETISEKLFSKYLETEQEVNQVLNEIQQEHPEFTIKELKEIIGGINIKFVESK